MRKWHLHDVRRREYQNGDEVTRELRSKTFLVSSLMLSLPRTSDVCAFGRTVAQAVNRAFAMSALSTDCRVSGYSEEKLSGLTDQICLEQTSMTATANLARSRQPYPGHE
ncbi:hypothetical protein JQ620_25940 [Bradyrhizobium sp. AUGA SZCCT0274]|uniref:hypothetical protein n=1 Tax=unclassified Bradyrhizobium TaxID=2631580 RepID=UPI001BA443C4|nr:MULTISPECIES: hypothetical protein [unclassified Bradyrhizobium]MBR1195725.1 hypothetical protein [Bradyrhizobium sp. AUGA SZCCT0158]MBR1243537.1 hypothetical protein [Bradyrhizobium sp. AUGA SZCCT0274]